MSVFTYAAIVNTGLWALVGWLGLLVWDGASPWPVVPMLALPLLFHVQPYVERSSSKRGPAEE